jgi:Tfp pilus assembly protein PilF
MTLAFWQAGKLEQAARAVRDWARVDPKRPAAHRFAARIYEDMGAVDLAEEAAARAAKRGPSDAGAWERLGRLRLKLMNREGALEAFRRALSLGSNEGELGELIEQALALEPRRTAQEQGATR